MWFGSMEKKTCLTALTFVIVLLLCLAPETQAYERLRITVGDTTGAPGEQNSVVTVFMTNTEDQIAAFTIHLILTRNDIANFQTELDSVIDSTYWKCTIGTPAACDQWVAVDFPDLNPWDSLHVDTVEAFTGNFDTVGTLISGWDMVTSRSVSTGDLGLDIKLSAIADQNSVPGFVPPISPQGGGVLFRLLADIFPIPPQLLDRTVNIQVDVSWKPYFVFATPAGEAVGWISVEVPDTNYYMCDSWEPPPGTFCYEWTKVHEWECPLEGCDSIGYGTVEIAVLDEEAVRLFDGSITVSQTCCVGRVGDANNLGGDEPTIGDVSILIDVLFISSDWSKLVCLHEADINQSGGAMVTQEDVTIGDISVLIDYLFITGSSLGLPDCL